MQHPNELLFQLLTLGYHEAGDHLSLEFLRLIGLGTTGPIVRQLNCLNRTTKCLCLAPNILHLSDVGATPPLTISGPMETRPSRRMP
jgi:hypothetical protein